MRASTTLLLLMGLVAAPMALVACGTPVEVDLGGGTADDDDDSSTDTTAPIVTIDSAPAATATNGTAVFEFSADETNVTFECKLGAAAFAACTSPHTINALAEGSYAFEVQGIDAASNVSTPATHSWAVDIIPRFNTEIMPYIAANCGLANGMCHNMASGRLITNTYVGIVNAAAVAPCAGETLIVPNNVGTSIMYQKMALAMPPCGNAQMPQGMAGGPGQAVLDMFNEWITKGAPEQ